MSQLSFTHVSFAYDTAATPVLESLDLNLHNGWTGVVGPNGCGKTTLLQLATGGLAPSSGAVALPESVRYCPQRVDDPPPDLTDLLAYPDADAGRLAAMLHIEADWPYRWDSLSNGEQKRAQLAVALWADPLLLALDEPTNHLDAAGRDLVIASLAQYRGIGLLVSHDRALLDRLCTHCLFIDQHQAPRLRPGGFSDGYAERDRERRATEREFRDARAEVRGIEAEANRRAQHAMVQDRKRSKRGLAAKDSDARAKIDAARVSGADGKAGRLLSQLDGRRARAHARLQAIDRPVRERVGVSVHGARSQRDTLLARPAGTLDLADGRCVSHPDLTIAGNDRIALTGPNGAGKTTLVGALLAESTVRADRILTIDQELSRTDSVALAQQLGALSPEVRGRVVSTVSRLGSDPRAVMATTDPSPGEARKIKLAIGLESEPWLIVLDEPTNHLDIVSIGCLEAALSQFAGAILLVSHDKTFIRSTCTTRWEISQKGVLSIGEIEP